MAKKVRIDEELCTGCGVCAETAPDVFELGDDGLAHVKPGMENAGDRKEVQQAADECPAGAIIIED